MSRTWFIASTVLLLGACASAPAPRAHEFDCDLSALEFYFTQPSAYASGPTLNPWQSSRLVSLDVPTGLTGADLSSLRVLEQRQRTFGPGERVTLREAAPLVPAVEFSFWPTAGSRFRDLERELYANRQTDPFRARGLAIVVGSQLFLAPSVSEPPPSPESPVVRVVELTSETRSRSELFSEAVAFLAARLSCES